METDTVEENDTHDCDCLSYFNCGVCGTRIAISNEEILVSSIADHKCDENSWWFGTLWTFLIVLVICTTIIISQMIDN